jgi:ElaB/YqjD/DUF883 family membrane-anchored ribosome-binding protein
MSDTSSRDLEREADASRAELSQKLETLKDRLTPGQVFDDLFGGSGANANAFLQNLGGAMRDNPMPSLLIGAGLVMMMMGGNRSQQTAPSSGSGPARPGAMDQARAAAHDARDGVQAIAGQAGEALASARDHVSEALGGAANAAGEQAAKLTSGIQSASQSAAHSTSKSTAQMASLVTDQPIIAASLGLALGAVLAAALPITETENRVLGAASDAAKGSLGTMVDEQTARVREAARTVLKDASDAAQAEGLTPDGAVAEATVLAGKIQAVADKTASSVRQEVDRLGS